MRETELGRVGIEELAWDERGLIPAIVQDVDTGEVLTLAWHKGATSGNTQAICEIRVDCDSDALLVLVHPAGPACHTGARSCFFRALGK